MVRPKVYKVTAETILQIIGAQGAIKTYIILKDSEKSGTLCSGFCIGGNLSIICETARHSQWFQAKW